jgi:hypothetical protein
MFLDGTIRESNSVAKRPVVPHGAAQMAVRINRVIAGFELHRRSREYATEQGGFSYGSLMLQYVW